MKANEALKVSNKSKASCETVTRYAIVALELGVERAARRGETSLKKGLQENGIDIDKVLKHFRKLGYRIITNDAQHPIFVMTWESMKTYVRHEVYVNGYAEFPPNEIGHWVINGEIKKSRA